MRVILLECRSSYSSMDGKGLGVSGFNLTANQHFVSGLYIFDKNILRISGHRGRRGGKGTESRGSPNQNVAGSAVPTRSSPLTSHSGDTRHTPDRCRPHERHARARCRSRCHETCTRSQEQDTDITRTPIHDTAPAHGSSVRIDWATMLAAAELRTAILPPMRFTHTNYCTRKSACRACGGKSRPRSAMARLDDSPKKTSDLGTTTTGNRRSFE